MDVSSPSHHGRHLVLGNTTGYTIFVRDLAQDSISHLAALAATRPLQPAVGRIPCLPSVAATGAASGIVSWLPPTTRNDLDPARQKGPMNRTARSASPNITFATLDVGGRHPPAATTEPVTRVGLIGLGVIGAVHLDVLRGFPNVVVVFVVDPRTPPEVRHRTVPRAPTLRAALELAQAPDLLVVATPTDTHLDLVADGLDQTRALVLSEKPLTRSATQLREFEANHAADLLRLRVVNHFAFSPEIEWAVRLVKAMGWGPPQQVIADFNDP